MAQTLNLKPRGLFTNPNPLSEVPPGALLVAQNCIQSKEGLIESRRGLKRYGTQFTMTGSEVFNKFFVYKDRLIVHYKNKMAYDSNGTGTFLDYSGTFVKPTGANSIRSVEANRNFYFTSSTGIKKLDTLAGTITQAGMYQGLDGTAVTDGVPGWMPDNTQVAYRVVWGIRDANNNLILGAPSQRIICVNTSGGPENVDITFTIPDGITTSHFFQIYRSAASSGATVVPNDELALVYEASPTAGEITAKEVLVNDITPENLRGAALYTNASQQGLDQSNYTPPIAQDMTVFKNHTFYANTISKQNRTITLVSVGGTGLVVNDTITIGGVVYTGKATETPASGEFLVETGLTPAENIEATAQSLVRVINKYASNTQYYAIYTSGFNDLPGRIQIIERNIGGTAYAFISSRGNAWNPVLPASGTSILSTNDQFKNGIYISKNLQPEAVPTVNVLFAGSADKNILRILALRDSIFILKEDGIFRITGEDITSFRVSLFDNTVRVLASDTAVTFSNQVFCWASQGIVALSDNGVAVMSRQIEEELLVLSSSLYTSFPSASFGVSYESDNHYIVFCPSETTDTVPTQAFVYNSITNEWTGPWLMTRTCGIVSPVDDKLYLGDPTVDYVYQERKDFTDNDYADDQFAINVTGSSGVTLTLTSTANVLAGMTIQQGTRKDIVISVDSPTVLTMQNPQTWALGAATANAPIPVAFQQVPLTMKNPGILKDVAECTLFFRVASFKFIQAGFSSNFSVFKESIELNPVNSGGWGLFPWGLIAWGVGLPPIQPLRTYIPLEKKQANWFNLFIDHNQALDKFSYAGSSWIYEEMSERFH